MEDLKRRLKKLLALSESPVEHEARTAMLKAQDLMDEHGMDAREALAYDDPSEKSVEDEVALSSGRLANWKAFAATVIAKNFRCFVYKQRITQTHLRFVGLTDDVAIAKEVFNFAIHSGEYFWREFYQKDVRDRAINRRHLHAIKNDYFRAFIQGLSDSFDQQVSEKGLVLSKDALVVNHYRDLGLSRGGSVTISTARDAAASHRGYQDGKSLRGGKSKFLPA